MSGSVWMFSDQIDDEDMDFMRHEFVTYSMAFDSEKYFCGISARRAKILTFIHKIQCPPVYGFHKPVGIVQVMHPPFAAHRRRSLVQADSSKSSDTCRFPGCNRVRLQSV